MTQTTMYATYQTEGSAALRPTPRQLTLIEGGKGSYGARTAQKVACPQTRSISGLAPRRSDIPALLFVCATALAIVLGTLGVNAIASARLAQDIATTTAAEVTVHAGDSVWALASEHPMEGRSTSEVVTWIMERNALETGTIVPGQVLLVPAAAE